MALPFEEQESRGRRKWQCFVCGVQFGSFDEFREHILAEHEEGREFVACPKCGSPIRDLKAHYKFGHVGWPIPAGCQHRATVWTDFAGNTAKKRPGVKFRSGTFVSGKMHGKELHYRSGFEAEVYEVLEQIPEVMKYDAEPIEIPYLHDGKPRNYRPDLSILFSDGRKEIWEIKPATQTSLPINEAKWTSANDYCIARGWKFMVLTEVGLGKLKRGIRTFTPTTDAPDQIEPEMPNQDFPDGELDITDDFQTWMDGDGFIDGS